MPEPCYRWWLIPNPRRWPRHRSAWLRPAVVLVVVVLVVTGAVTLAPWLAKRLVCRDGLPSGEIYSAGGECVGITDGSYAFGVPGFDQVFRRIRDQNEAAAGACGAQRRQPVTIGVLMSLNHPDSGSRARHELEGFAAGQARANQPGCLRPVRLRVGHTGSAEQEAERVAGLLRGDPNVMAVVGLGLSGVNAAKAVNLLGKPVEADGTPPVPMVADLITAEGFDSDGTADAAGCADESTLRAGVGGSYFFRVAYRNAQQIDELATYLGATVRPTFIVTPTTRATPLPAPACGGSGSCTRRDSHRCRRCGSA